MRLRGTGRKDPGDTRCLQEKRRGESPAAGTFSTAGQELLWGVLSACLDLPVALLCGWTCTWTKPEEVGELQPSSVPCLTHQQLYRSKNQTEEQTPVSPSLTHNQEIFLVMSGFPYEILVLHGVSCSRCMAFNMGFFWNSCLSMK